MYTTSSDPGCGLCQPSMQDLPAGPGVKSGSASSEQAAVLSGQILRLLQEEFMIRFPAFPEIFGQLILVSVSQIKTALAAVQTKNSSLPEYGLSQIPEETIQTAEHHRKFPPMEAALGTDGSHLYYEPTLLCTEFLQFPNRLKRAYLHVHVHCLCLHMFQAQSCQKHLEKNHFHSDMPPILEYKEKQDGQESMKQQQTFEHRKLQNEIPSSGCRKNLWDQACDLSAELMTCLLLGENQDLFAEQLSSAIFELSSSEAETILPETGNSNFGLEKNAHPVPDSLKASGFEFRLPKTRYSGFDLHRSSDSNSNLRRRPDCFKSNYLDASFLLPLLEASPSLQELAAQCSCDTHRFWYEEAPNADDSFPEQARASADDNSGRKSAAAGHRSSFLRLQETLADKWMDQRRRLNTFLSNGGGHKNKEAGRNTEDAALQKRDAMDYRKFLHQFAVPREEPILDTDSFDYIPYCYGLTYYENMPFLEPLEYSEVNRLDELAIAIDTSGSCSGQIVRRFLEETWNILRQKENFFSRMRLHLIQCDSMIQDHQIFTSVEQWEEALPSLKIQGLGNTDFRPVFDYLNTLIQKKEIRRLRGLLYFTDGDGIYPRSRPPFDTAFVFLNRRLEKQKIPDWGIRLNLDLPETFDR